MRKLQPAQVGDAKPCLAEELGHGEPYARHARDVIIVKWQWLDLGGDRHAKIDEVKDGRRLEIAGGSHGDRRDPGLSRMCGQLDRVGQAVVADVHGDPHRRRRRPRPSARTGPCARPRSATQTRPSCRPTKTPRIPVSRNSAACCLDNGQVELLRRGRRGCGRRVSVRSKLRAWARLRLGRAVPKFRASQSRWFGSANRVWCIRREKM